MAAKQHAHMMYSTWKKQKDLEMRLQHRNDYSRPYSPSIKGIIYTYEHNVLSTNIRACVCFFVYCRVNANATRILQCVVM